MNFDDDPIHMVRSHRRAQSIASFWVFIFFLVVPVICAGLCFISAIVAVFIHE